MEVNAEIKKATDPIYQKVSKTIPEIEWAILQMLTKVTHLQLN